MGGGKLALTGLTVAPGLTILGSGIGSALAAASDNTTDDARTTAMVLASDNEASQQDIVVSDLADRLGLEEDAVAAAIKEVRREMREEALPERLQKAVEDDSITEDEADQVPQWTESRPSALEELGGLWLRVEEDGLGMGHRGSGAS
jgi:hypothetical protein